MWTASLFFMVRWARQYPLVMVVVATVAVQVIVYGSFLSHGDAAFLRSNDSPQYLTAAANLQQYHRFAEYEGNPPVSSMFKMPGYPVFLLFTNTVSTAPWFTALVQNVLLLLTVVVAYAVILRLWGTTIAFWAALLYGVEPFSSFQANLIMTDTLFTLLLVFGFYGFVRARQETLWRWPVFGALCFAAATYVRAVGIYLVVLLALWWAVELLRERRGFRQMAAVAIFLAVVVGMLAPWVVKNGRQFGLWKLSTQPNFNLYLYQASYALAQREGRSVGEVRGELIVALDALPQDVALRDRFLGTRSREILWENLRWFLPVYAVKAVPFFIQSGWRDIVEVAGFPSTNRPVDFGGALLRRQWGTISSGLRQFDAPSVAHVLGALLWGFISVLAVCAPVLSWRRDRANFSSVLLLCTIILLFALLTSPISHARYRQPVQPWMFALAVYTRFQFQKIRQKNSALHKVEISTS